MESKDPTKAITKSIEKILLVLEASGLTFAGRKVVLDAAKQISYQQEQQIVNPSAAL